MNTATLERWAKQLAYFRQQMTAIDEREKSLETQLRQCKHERVNLKLEMDHAQEMIDAEVKVIGESGIITQTSL